MGYISSAKYPLIYKTIQDDRYLLKFESKYKLIFRIWWLLADCGRSFWRWSLWSLGFAVGFALIYFFGFYQQDPTFFEAKYVSSTCPFCSFLYYSFVTFTTLGFGDIIPKTGWLQFWVTIEVILGYVMLGGLISIFANKLARRS